MYRTNVIGLYTLLTPVGQGELEHRHVKRFYARTNKHKYEYQIAQHTRRAEKLRIIKARVDAHRAQEKALAAAAEQGDSAVQKEPVVSKDGAPGADADDMAYASPWDRYHIAKSQRDGHEITAWATEHADDPAFKVRGMSCTCCAHSNTLYLRISFLAFKPISSRVWTIMRMTPTTRRHLCTLPATVCIITVCSG